MVTGGVEGNKTDNKKTTGKSNHQYPHMLRDTIILLAIIGVYLCIVIPQLQRPFDWDEVDYATAAKLGIISNALDTTSMTPRNFVAFGVLKLAAKKYGQEMNTSQFFDTYDESKDTVLLRHKHPPVPIYAYAVVGRFFGFTEWSMRLVSVMAIIALIIISFYSIRKLFPMHAHAPYYVAVLLALNPVLLLSATGIWFHAVFTLVYVIMVLLFGYAWHRNTLKSWYVAFVVLGIALATLEHALFTAVIVLFLLLIVPNRLMRVTRSGITCSWHLLGVLTACISTTILIWPGALIKLSFLKFIGMYAYQYFLVGVEWQQAGRFLTTFIAKNPLFVLGMVASLLLVWWRKRLPVQAQIIVLIPALQAVLAWKTFLTEVHVTFIVAAFCLSIGVLLDEVLKRYAGTRAKNKKALQAALILIVAWIVLNIAFHAYSMYPVLLDPQEMQPILKGNVLADGGHILRWYFPELPITSVTVDSAGLFVREKGVYRNIEQDVRSHQFDTIVLRNRPMLQELLIVQELTQNCTQQTSRDYRIFSCA